MEEGEAGAIAARAAGERCLAGRQHIGGYRRQGAATLLNVLFLTTAWLAWGLCNLGIGQQRRGWRVS